MNLPPYPKYKPSGVEWIGDVPEHWDILPIKRRYHVVNGGTPISTEERFWGNGINWITPEDLGRLRSKQITGVRRMLSPEGLENCGAQIVPPHSIVLSTRAPIGHLAIIEKESCTNQGCRTLVPNDRNNCSSYTYYTLTASRPILQAAGKGTTFMELSADLLGLYRLPFPPYSEQQIIADFLDRETEKIDSLIARQRTLIERQKEKRVSLVIRTVTQGLPPRAARAVGLDPYLKLKSSGVEWIGSIPDHWNVVSISRITETIQTGPFGSQLHAEDYVEGGIPVINPSHLITNNIVPDERSTLDEPTAQRLARHRFAIGDIVMARRGEIGRCGVVGPREVGWICGTGSFIIRLKQCDALYYAMIFSETGFSKFLNLNAIGATMANLNPAIIGKMLIPVPPLHEQTAIAAYLNAEKTKHDTLVAKIRSSIERLQEYRMALITSAVIGEIDVRSRSISNQMSLTDQ